MKKIKVISSYFLPYQNANAFAIGKKILGISESYNIDVYTYNLDNKTPKSKFWEKEIKKIKINYLTKIDNNGLKRIIDSLRYVRNISSDGNVIVSYFHLSELAYLCAILKLRDNIPWIAIYSDPPKHMIPIWGKENIGLVKRIYNLFSSIIPTKITLKYCDKIVFNDKWQAEFILNGKNNKYKDKAVIIQMGAEISEEDVASLNTENNKVIIRYIGELNKIRNGLEFLRGVDIFFENNKEYVNKVVIEFYGNVFCNETIDVAVKMKYRDNVKFNESVTYEEAQRLMRESNILLVIDGNIEGISNIYPYTPSKIIDYVGARKPILGVSMYKSPTHDICLETNNWWSSFDEEEIALVIKRCIDNYKFHKYSKEILYSYSNEYKALRFKKVINNEIDLRNER